MSEILERLGRSLADRYQVTGELGQGGMATVYLAHDLKHERDVAIKVLHPDLGAALGAERFLSEIKTTAKLQHPHILPLLDSGAADGLLYYVMPYVRGETLRARLERERQLPIDDALRIAREVAGALDHAHKQGIIHRDIKPENILLQDGAAVVADFGIALAVQTAGGARMTQTGLSLGTPQYMAPEQAMGEKSVDARADVYALGAVTYEMLAGEPPFTGPTAQAVVAKMMSGVAQPVDVLRPNVPPAVARALARAIEKLPADRFASAAAFAQALDGTTELAPPPTTRRARKPWGWVAAVVLVTTASIVTTHRWTARGPSPATDAAPIRFALTLRRDERISDGLGSPFAVSADGRVLVYGASRGGQPTRLYVRPLEDMESRELAGTDGAEQPAISSDGRWVAYVVNNQVRKVPMSGGASITLATVPTVRGITWVPGGDLVLGTGSGGLKVVPAGGGVARSLTTVRDSVLNGHSHRWPVALADGQTIAYTDYNDGGLSSSRISLTRLDDGSDRRSDITGTFPLGLAGEHLLYASAAGSVMAVRADLRAGTLVGAPVQLPEQIAVNPGSTNATAALSPSGTLLYRRGGFVSQLVSVDRAGAATVITPEARLYQHPRLSPDGRKIAVSILEENASDIWVLDRERGTPARLTHTPNATNERPEWSPDGRALVFRSTRTGTAVWAQATDGVQAGRNLTPDVITNEAVYSPDGEFLMLRVSSTGGHYNQDLAWRRVRGDTTLHDFVVTPFTESGPRFSRDGRWIAYASDESAMRQVYVTPFPGPGPRFQLSVDGGEQPLWSRDGRTLYYRKGRQLIAATLDLSSSARVVNTQVLFEGNYVGNYTHSGFDEEPDGQHFLMLRPMDGEEQTLVIVGWLPELARRLQLNDKR